ncbi:MAG: nitroreductase family protein, partial [Eubacteriales bacterium]|nr:nitroreductase family protein [Eubacteriales bacterium]
DFRFGAPVLIIATAPVGWPNGMADCAVALQNMQLAATSLELGACWVNQLHWLTQNEALRKFLEPYGIEKCEDIYGSIVLGNASPDLPKAAPRKKSRVRYIK